ncbi:hypothetical protein EDB19DRAFT_1262221 [Suillus lakei]|nr:hypothetical protein EDB19DRAFT_1262221 [Suillus lakei]
MQQNLHHNQHVDSKDILSLSPQGTRNACVLVGSHRFILPRVPLTSRFGNLFSLCAAGFAGGQETRLLLECLGTSPSPQREWLMQCGKTTSLHANPCFANLYFRRPACTPRASLCQYVVCMPHYILHLIYQFFNPIYCLLGAVPDVDSTCYTLWRSFNIADVGIIEDYWQISYSGPILVHVKSHSGTLGTPVYTQHRPGPRNRRK